MKTVLFAPGGMEDLTDRDYQSVFAAIESKGYKVVFVPITWSRTTIDDWVRELLTTYEQYDPKDTILAGFSWGSMTAFVAASKRPPAALWLFSLSPFFAGDAAVVKARTKMQRYMGKHRLEAFEELNFTALAAHIPTKTLIFMGEIELPDLRRRCEIAASTLQNATLIIVPKTHHNVENPAYIAAIQQHI